MAHNDSYLEGMKFGNGDTQVDIPFHDPEALHDEDGVVKENQIEDGAVTEDKLAENAVTEDKLADGCVTADKIDPGLKEEWDSRFQKIVVEPQDGLANPLVSLSVGNGTLTNASAIMLTGRFANGDTLEFVITPNNRLFINRNGTTARDI